jgi:(R)-2-hydroxyacyl-CoA dehydratese activating ATPase
MQTAGLDIGSRSIELVVIESASGTVLQALEVETTPDMEAVCRDLIARISFDRLIVTGYGRTLAECSFGFPSVTEIKAYARGARARVPGCRTVLDIGGQDTKAIALDACGRVASFEMNDRCAAGAGRFLEMIASALKYTLPELGVAALSGDDGVQINSMCAVFAESEVIGLLTRGARRQDIALAAHRSIAVRAAGMLARIGCHPPVVFAGGAALNPCLVQLIRDLLKFELAVPQQPHTLGALGAALLAADF